jgi:hypothetical protein
MIMKEDLIYLQNEYRGCMMKILNNPEISYIDREFYSESPNWYTNNDFKNIIDTLVWLSLTDTEKKEKLDKELDDLKI